MSEYIIMTDSCCDLSDEMAKELELNVVPLTVHLEGKDYPNYLDGSAISNAEFYGAINGSFTCVGMELEGAFDIYRAHRALIFERWDVDKLRRRANGKGQVRTGCDCSATW